MLSVPSDPVPTGPHPGEPPEAPEPPEPLRDVVRAMGSLFPELHFLEPGGQLEVTGPFEDVRSLRLTVPDNFLVLQSLGLDLTPSRDARRGGVDGDDLLATATVSASSWYGPRRDAFSWPALLDFDHPQGTVLHTGHDTPSWFEVRFDRPVQVDRIRLRNVASHWASRAKDLRIDVTHADGGSATVYHWTDRAAELRRQVQQWPKADLGDDATTTAGLAEVAALVAAADYPQARAALYALKVSREQRQTFTRVVDSEVLSSRKLQWVSHGPQRVFRFWSQKEKAAYLRQAVDLVEQLRPLSPLCCLGFGSVLAAVRDGDLIPHDDDLDLIVGLERHQASTLGAAMEVVADTLRQRGYEVTTGFTSHVKAAKGKLKPVDVFVSVFEGDTISWYPGVRGSLNRSIMLPLSEGQLLGEVVPLPHNPFLYLERVYGASWRVPNAEYRHRWNKAQYSDLR